ncbi:hypothetical protein HUW51_02635 [Adhaeribacter swui]|uniref:Uncharacterized protein n=1 Tax=Adhaeribacter swui TaxID=2086471 RepID=A0A7G7G3D9_9BACT|nr:hypothetical protein [Adhaeribacter swui]QNF31673.1 hypothetical protein HUW51_02635 [Adhaeribacter swui]
MMYSKFLTPAIFSAEESTIQLHIQSFWAGYTKCIYLALGLSGIGLYLKSYQLLTDKLLVFTLATLALLFLGQMLLSFSFMLKNLGLALLGSFCSLALATGFTSVLFLFQGWWGSGILITLTAPLAAVSLLILIGFILQQGFNRRRKQRFFLLCNLLIPFGVLLLLGTVAFFKSKV